MSRDIAVDSLFFSVEQVPVEAVANQDGKERRIVVPGKKALLNAANGTVLGVVSRDYKVVTNQEAVQIAREVCAKAFPGIAPLEWDAKRASAPRTLSYAFIDLMHRTHVLNYMENEGDESDPFTPVVGLGHSGGEFKKDVRRVERDRPWLSSTHARSIRVSRDQTPSRLR